MTLEDARSTPAWPLIEDRMREVSQAACADFLPVMAHLIDIDGAQFLEVVALTDDLELSETGRQVAAMRFRAPLDSMPVDALVH